MLYLSIINYSFYNYYFELYIFCKTKFYNFNCVQEFRERSRSRSPLLPRGGIDVIGEFLEDGEPSRRVLGVRGRTIFADPDGYTYVQNRVSTNRRSAVK